MPRAKAQLPPLPVRLEREYRLLPVKFSQVDSSGNVTEEMVISGIRAKDE